MITEELCTHAWHPRLQSEGAGARMWQKVVGFWLLGKGGCWIREFDFMGKRKKGCSWVGPNPVSCSRVVALVCGRWLWWLTAENLIVFGMRFGMFGGFLRYLLQ